MTVVDESHLTDRQSVKDWCNITTADAAKIGDGTTALSAFLDNLIVRASNLIMMEIGRTKLFTQTAQTETRNGNDRCEMFLLNRPINNVTSVTVDGIVIPQRTVVSPYINLGWSFDSDMVYLEGYKFTMGRQNVVVIYDYGITVTSRDASILEQGVLEMINMKYARRLHADQLNEKSGNFVTIQFRPDDIPPETNRVIEKLRHRVPFE